MLYYIIETGELYMYKLIIADDEPKIISLLCKLINWEELGFEIVFTARDGNDVIKYINANHTDCILSDIKMIDVTGIDLAKYVYNKHPKIKVILFSAYQEFDYAQNALKYNVYDYVNKPINVDELILTFKALKADLDKSVSNSELISHYIRSMLCDLIDRKFKNLHEVVPLFKLISKDSLIIGEQTHCYILKIKCFPNWKNDIEDMHINFLSNIAQIPKQDIVTCFVRNVENMTEYIMFSNTASQQQFMDMANEIVKNLNTFLNASANISEYTFYARISELFSDNNKNNSFVTNIKNFKNNFVQAVISGTVSDIYEYISILFKLHLSLYDVKDVILNIIAELYELTTVTDSTSKTNSEIFDEFRQSVTLSEDISEINNMCNKYFIELSNELRLDDEDSIEADIIMVRNYIFEHLDEYLSLNEMARMIHLSPKYFSKKFKQIVGKTFSDFIISCKMNHAKELLIETDEKISSICSKIGYDNPNFFATLFKKYYNMSPSEYRKKYRKKYSVNGDDDFGED